MKNKTIEAIKDAIRHPYCWPGGYTKRIIMSDGMIMCTPCAKEHFRYLVSATKDDTHCYDQWRVMGVEIYWEGRTEFCCQCNREIDSEYGDPDEPEPPIELSYSVFTIPGEHPLTLLPYHVGIDKPGLRVVKYSFKTLEDAEKCLTNLKHDALLEK